MQSSKIKAAYEYIVSTQYILYSQSIRNIQHLWLIFTVKKGIWMTKKIA